MSECILTQQQNAQIYCVKHGHAKYFYGFFGYAYCGRCGDQIGDSIAGIFDGKGMVLVGHDCNECTKVIATLSQLDLKILKRLEADKSHTYDYEKILKGIKF